MVVVLIEMVQKGRFNAARQLSISVFSYIACKICKFGNCVILFTKCILHLNSVQQLWDYCIESFSTHVPYSMGMRMPSLQVSEYVFRVGASVRTFVELQNALHLFQQQTHS